MLCLKLGAGNLIERPPVNSDQKQSTVSKRALLVTALAVVTLALTGCADEVKRGFLPGYSDGKQVTNMTERITNLWVGSWIAALIVGFITWGLIIWCIVVYRKRKGDERLPIQTRYHLPLEIMYTIIPIVLIGVLFFFTQRDTSAIRDTSQQPDVTIQIIGKQWAWDFNYLDSDVYESTIHVLDVGEKEGSLGEPGTHEDLPMLYLPVNKKVEFQLESRDVIHSFWIPAFLDKMDMIPYQSNVLHVTPTREGIYAGKCAELCGEYHSGMIFNVAVVSESEYEKQMQALRDAGQTGSQGLENNRLPHVTHVGSQED